MLHNHRPLTAEEIGQLREILLEREELRLFLTQRKHYAWLRNLIWTSIRMLPPAVISLVALWGVLAGFGGEAVEWLRGRP